MKLSTKLIIAFLLVSLFSTGTIVVSTRLVTDREFDKFVNKQYQTELITQLANYYEENQTWSGVEKLFSRDPDKNKRPPFFSIADTSGTLVIAGMGRRPGETVSPDELDAGTKVQVNDKTVGIVLFSKPPDRNPLEDEFLRRLRESIYLSAIGTILLAFILGAFLSRTISRPIRELTKATHEMAGGKFGQQVPVRSSDEIGELASSFNKMNNDLAHSSNLRRQMTADIAHELRTPLSLIIGHAEAVHDGVLPASKENFEIIREEAERLEQLVNDLRTLSLADAGELSADFQLVDLNKLLGEVKAHYMVQFNQKQITLDLEADSTLHAQAEIDPTRFLQVFTNILDNALRYTPKDGRVLISTKEREGQIEISIQDSGEGVPPEEAARLFDRFYRTDSSRTRDQGGSGLGLAIAKSIVEMHRGKIWAESETGKGLKVIILLPVHKD
jgi:two-component system, OmpR family, sensor histidine kinase BaeS